MIIIVNGENLEVAKDINVLELLTFLQFKNKMVAVEISGEIITKSEHANHVIQAGDTIEIIKAVGGG